MGLFLTAIMAISEWIIAAIVTGFVTLFMQLIWLIYLGDKKTKATPEKAMILFNLIC
jgi:hypothetical protein